MTIRRKLALWYAAVLFASVVSIVTLSYHELNEERQKTDEANEGLGEALAVAAWCGIPAGVLAIAGGWWLMRQALGPVADLTRAAEKIHERNLHEQLPRSGNGDELDRLTEVFNAMTARLNGSFQRIREFTLHASHELKTPLTVMQGELETELAGENLPPTVREHLLSQLDEIQRLAKIVDGLTLLTKADAGQIKLNREPVQIDELFSEAHADAQVLARPHDVEVTLIASEKAVIQGDRHRLRQLLLNLTDNAVKYNQPKGTVTMSLRRADRGVEMVIANSGPGIPPESQPRVFDRFFRGDASHNHNVDGCGLGLSIAQWIVNAHGGTIKISSQPGALTSVTVSLPPGA